MRTTRHYTIAAACPMSGISTVRVPRAGWRRDDPGDTGDSGTHGGGGTGDDGDGQGDKDAPDGDGKTPKNGDGKTPKIKGDYDPERASRALAAAREGEKKARAEAKAERERLAAILKAAGLTPDGRTDPEAALKETAAKAEAAAVKARASAVELAVYKSAGKAGADPDALLDSRGFLAALADADPDAADFGDKIEAAIKAAIKTNPRLAATSAPQGSQGPAKQGADHNGGSGGKQRPASLGAALAARMSGR